MNQNKAANDLTNGCSLRSVNDASVVVSGSREPEKISVLCEHDPTLFAGKGQMVFIGCPTHICFWNSENIYPALSKSSYNRKGNMLVGVVANDGHWARAFSLVCHTDGVCVRKASTKSSSSRRLWSMSSR